MNVSIHINFKGQCEEAFEFYAENLGGKIGTMLRFKDSPHAALVANERQNEVVHANIQIANVELAGADVSVDQYRLPAGFCLLLGLESEEKVQSFFNVLQVGGKVILSPQKTFWSPCYAIVLDRFGVPWKLNCGT